MSGDHPEVIIIGGGIGGLITGAILAQREGMKVLLLEKEKFLGGKTFSFEHSEFDPPEFKHLLYTLSRSKIVRSDPPLEELLAKKAFKDFIFEGGWHGFIAADRSRMSFILRALGKDLEVTPVRGLRWWGDGKWVGLRDLMRGWTRAEMLEGREVSRTMHLMSRDEASACDHVDLRSYLLSRASSPKVRQFHEVLASWEAGLNDPAQISTGEHINVVNMVHLTGRDFEMGGAGEPKGGFNTLTRAFAAIIEENGGVIKTATPVTELVIENYTVKGVKAGKEEYYAPKVVCNVPLQRVYPLVPREYWPPEFAARIDRIWAGAGVFGWVCTKPPFDPGFAGVYVAPVLPGCGAKDGFRGDVLFTFEDAGVMDPSRVPPGHGLMAIYAGLLPYDPDEIHNPVLVNRVADAMLDFLKMLMPDFKERVQWYFITAADELYSLALTPGLIGNRRLPVTHPLIKNLYFTGDSIAQWSFGMSGAAGGAVNCAGAVSGRDQSVILPPYMR